MITLWAAIWALGNGPTWAMALGMALLLVGWLVLCWLAGGAP